MIQVIIEANTELTKIWEIIEFQNIQFVGATILSLEILNFPRGKVYSNQKKGRFSFIQSY